MKRPSRHLQAGFTLIELMAVITIIILLAGLVVGGMGFVSERQAKEKAKTQIALLSKALEEYKLDNGTYPPTTNKSGSFSGVNGTATSSIIFKALYFDGVQDSTKRIYLGELDPASSKQGWTSGTASAGTTIVDPWGNQYCYRTAVNANTTGSNTNADTMNPDFDLWSMGKDAASAPASPTDPKNRDDIRNF